MEFIFSIFHGHLVRSGLAAAVSPELLDSSLEDARELANTADKQVLLHGDLHPANRLCGGRERGLVAIDPRACRGDPAFDLIDWVLADVTDSRKLIGRSEWLAYRAEADPSRLWRWCRPNSESRLLMALAAEEV